MKGSASYFVLRGTVILLFAVLVIRLWYMQVVQVKAYRAEAVATRLQYRTVLAPRGIIYDRNGIPLVRNLPNLDVTVLPEDWPQASSGTESRLLSHLLKRHPSPARIRTMINAGRGDPTRAVPIKTHISLHAYYLIRSHQDALPGVQASIDLTRRKYLGRPPWPLAHILGYTGAISPQQYKAYASSNGPYRSLHYTYLDDTGQTGIEEVYEGDLHGVNGLEAAEVNAMGDQVSPWRVVRASVPGYGVRLTIDARLEQEAAADLQLGLQKLQVTQGAAVVMNPWNGQVLALVSLPSFNPNIFTAPSSRARSRRIMSLAKSPSAPFLDIATQSAMPPGSIYKVITATAGLATHVITPSTVVDDTGSIQRCPGCPVFHGWNPGGLGPVNVVSAIEQSSDIFFYQVAGGGPDLAGTGVGPIRLGRWARRYGLGRPTGIGLPSEAAGLVPSPHYLRRTQHRSWSYGDSYNMGVGQGDDLVTPLQMATVASVIANGGSLVRPRIVQAITSGNGHRILPGHDFGLVPDYVHRHFVPTWIISLIQQGMRLGVTSPAGTSHWNVDLRNQSAGKTGTAETPTGVDGWWIGFAPFNHPQIAVCVVVPNSGAEGAFSGAPIGSKIIDDYLHISDPGWLRQVEKEVLYDN